MSVISRQPLRRQIRSHLVERLLGGDLEPGTHINESELTEELGVSRTPLREALLQLKFEGLLRSQPGRGFTVAPLEARELEELFDLAIELETLGLRLAAGVSDGVLAEMRDVNDRRSEIARDGGGPDEQFELDDHWHRLLVSGCDNEQLHELLRLIHNRLYRYIFAFEGVRPQMEAAIRDHEEIMDALARDDVEGAAERLRRHGRAAEAAIKELLAQND